MTQFLRCQYNAEHRRGRPASPEPATPNYDQTTANIPSTPASQGPLPNDATKSPQEAEETRFEGDYIGPTSGIAFLRRAQRRFQDFAGTISSNLDGHQGSTSIFSFGDGWVPGYSVSEFVFPNIQEAKHLFNRYFDFAMPTYRFLHRATAQGWLDNIYDNKQSVVNAKNAIVLLILATAKLYGKDEAGLLRDGQAKDSEER
jgi:hypothetical protein